MGIFRLLNQIINTKLRKKVNINTTVKLIPQLRKKVNINTTDELIPQFMKFVKQTSKKELIACVHLKRAR